jgi:hypothetical protein
MNPNIVDLGEKARATTKILEAMQSKAKYGIDIPLQTKNYLVQS